MPSEPRVLEITEDNWRKTGLTINGGAAGKTDRIPATGQNLPARREAYDRINWQSPYCPRCLRDPHEGRCA